MVNFYAWTAGQVKVEQRRKTEALMKAIHQELQMQPDLPTLWCGDLNALPGGIPTLAMLLDCGRLHDIAAIPEFCPQGGPYSPAKLTTSQNALGEISFSLILVYYRT